MLCIVLIFEDLHIDVLVILRIIYPGLGLVGCPFLLISSIRCDVLVPPSYCEVDLINVS